MSRHYEAVARRAGRRCEYCHAPEIAFNFPFEVEHVVPTSRGGTDDPENLCLACRACNLRKSDHLTWVDESSGLEVSLFHPRTRRWSDHFAVDVESCEIQGITPTGRATVNGLDCNHPLQLSARQFWTRLRLFP